MLAFPVPRTCSPFPVASRRGRKHTALLFCSAGPRVTWASVPGQCVVQQMWRVPLAPPRLGHFQSLNVASEHLVASLARNCRKIIAS